MDILISVHEALVKSDCRWETQSSFASMLTDVILLLTTPREAQSQTHTTSVKDIIQLLTTTGSEGKSREGKSRESMKSELDEITFNISIAEELFEGSKYFPSSLAHFAALGDEIDVASLAENPQLKVCKWAEWLRTGIVDASNNVSTPSTVNMEKAFPAWLVEGVELLSKEVEAALSDAVSDILHATENLGNDSRRLSSLVGEKDGESFPVVIPQFTRVTVSRRKEKEKDDLVSEAIAQAVALGVRGVEKAVAAAVALKNCSETKLLPLVTSVRSLLSKLVDPSSEDSLRGMVIRMHGCITECIESLDINQRYKGLEKLVSSENESPTEEWMKLVAGEVSSLKEALRRADTKLTTILDAFNIEEDLLRKQAANVKGIAKDFVQKYTEGVRSLLERLVCVVNAILQTICNFDSKFHDTFPLAEARKLLQELLAATIPSRDIASHDSNIFVVAMDHGAPTPSSHETERSLAEVMSQFVSLQEGLLDKATNGIFDDKGKKAVSSMVTAALSHMDITQAMLERITNQSAAIIDEFATDAVQSLKEVRLNIDKLETEKSKGVISEIVSAVDKMLVFASKLNQLNIIAKSSVSLANNLTLSLEHVGICESLFVETISGWCASSSAKTAAKTAISHLHDHTMHVLEAMASEAAVEVVDVPTNMASGLVGKSFLHLA